MAKPSQSETATLIPNPKARLLDQVREVMRFHHYALRTEEAYLQNRLGYRTGQGNSWSETLIRKRILRAKQVVVFAAGAIASSTCATTA